MKNVFVLFSPGTGGNHLANMLSTDSRFIQRSTVDDYSTYKKRDAHTSGIKNLNLSQLELLPSLGNVLCGHFGEYYWLSLSGMLEKFVNRQIFIIEVPQQGTLAWERYNDMYPMIDYFFEEQRSLYTMQIIEKTFNEHDIISLPCELLFDETLSRLFEHIATQCDLVPNQQICKQMHEIWYNKLLHQITEKG